MDRRPRASSNTSDVRLNALGPDGRAQRQRPTNNYPVRPSAPRAPSVRLNRVSSNPALNARLPPSGAPRASPLSNEVTAAGEDAQTGRRRSSSDPTRSGTIDAARPRSGTLSAYMPPLAEEATVPQAAPQRPPLAPEEPREAGRPPGRLRRASGAAASVLGLRNLYHANNVDVPPEVVAANQGEYDPRVVDWLDVVGMTMMKDLRQTQC